MEAEREIPWVRGVGLLLFAGGLLLTWSLMSLFFGEIEEVALQDQLAEAEDMVGVQLVAPEEETDEVRFEFPEVSMRTTLLQEVEEVPLKPEAEVEVVEVELGVSTPEPMWQEEVVTVEPESSETVLQEVTEISDVGMNREPREETQVSQESDVAGLSVPAREGHLPPLVAEFRNTMGFGEYLALIERAGAQLLLYDKSERMLIGRLNRERRVLEPIEVGGVSQLSGRTRRVDHDPWLQEMIRLESTQRGGELDWLIFFPREWDTRVYRLLVSAMDHARLEPGEVRQINAHYRLGSRPDRGALVLVSAVLNNGETVPMRGTLSIP